MTTPPPGQALTAETVKPLVKGDLLRVVGPFGRLRHGDIVHVKTAGDFNLSVEEDVWSDLNPTRFTFIGRPDADGWIAWSGGDNPAPGVRVDWRARSINGVFTGVPDDSDWRDIIAFRLASQSTAPTRGEDAYVGEWQDKAEGLEADLRSAVMVVWKRGATDWCRLNYPQWLDWLEASHTPPEPVALTAGSTPERSSTDLGDNEPVASAVADGEGLEVEQPHVLTLTDGTTARCSEAAWKWFNDWAVRWEQESIRATQAEARADRLAKALERIKNSPITEDNPYLWRWAENVVRECEKALSLESI